MSNLTLPQQGSNFVSSMDSRIAIVGANGAGKSTLLNLIMSALQPCEGTVSKHVQLKIAKYSQHSADQLPYDSRPIEYFQSLFSQKYPDKDVQAWRAQLGRFGLSGSHQTSPIKQLSDGLRNRYVHRTSAVLNDSRSLLTCHRSVVFAQLSMEHPHILLLGMSVLSQAPYPSIVPFSRSQKSQVRNKSA